MIAIPDQHSTTGKAMQTLDKKNDQKGRYHELGKEHHCRDGTHWRFGDGALRSRPGQRWYNDLEDNEAIARD
jgi:hypothetical protein